MHRWTSETGEEAIFETQEQLTAFLKANGLAAKDVKSPPKSKDVKGPDRSKDAGASD